MAPALDDPGIHGRAVDGRSNDLVGGGVRVRNVTGDLFLLDSFRAEGERHGLFIAVLDRKPRIINGIGAQPRTGAGLEPPQPQTQRTQRTAQALCGEIAGTAGGVIAVAHMDEALEERPGGQYGLLGLKHFAHLGFDAQDMPVTTQERLDAGLLDSQIVTILQHTFHPLAIKRLVGLRPRSPDCGPLPGVEHTKLDAGFVDGPGHLAPEGIDFLDQMPLSNSTDGGITGHLTDMVQVQRQHQRVEPHACGSQRGFDARMSGPDDDDVVDPAFSLI